MNTIQDALISYGLTDKEARLYFAAVSLGTASITQLARKANLKRPTTYLTIESLLSKNLLIAIPRGRTFHYKAQDPKFFINTIEEHKKTVLNILPALEKLYAESSSQPNVRFYEGKDKLMQLYEEIFRSPEIHGLLSIDAFSRVFTMDDEKHLFRLLARHGGRIYDIMKNTKLAKTYATQKYRTGVGHVKLLHKGLSINTDIAVTDKLVATFSFPTITAVAIEDPSIAATIKMMMQCMWEQLPNSDT